jgi:uncharacterized protein
MPGESYAAFVARCSAALEPVVPDQDQRAVACENSWQAGEDKAMCHLDIEVKLSPPSETGEFEGVASVFGEVDLVGDQVAPGAFKKSLAAHRRAGRMPLLLWMHRLDELIGIWTDIRETAHGLAVKGRLILDTVRGREAHSLLKARALDGLSIGFRTLKSLRTQTGRLLQEVDLAEISLVALPALASARVHSVKSWPRREPAHPSEGNRYVSRIVDAGRYAGRSLSPRSIAARAYRDARDPRR